MNHITDRNQVCEDDKSNGRIGFTGYGRLTPSLAYVHQKYKRCLRSWFNLSILVIHNNKLKRDTSLMAINCQ